MNRTMDLYSYLTLSITNCATVKLTERNYILWKCQFEYFLSGQELLGFVTASTPAPASTIIVPGIDGTTSEMVNPDHQAWTRSDQVSRAWLLGYLSEDILSVVVGANTAQDVWVSLAKQFNRVSFSRLFELQRRLQTVSKGSKSMGDYLREVKNLCDQLTSIGNHVSEKMKIFAALNGLGQEYEPIKTIIEGSMDAYPAPIYEDVVPRLTAFDDRLQSYTEGSTVTPHMAFSLIKLSPLMCITTTTTIEVGDTLMVDMVQTEEEAPSQQGDVAFINKSLKVPPTQANMVMKIDQSARYVEEQYIKH